MSIYIVHENALETKLRSIEVEKQGEIDALKSELEAQQCKSDSSDSEEGPAEEQLTGTV